MQKDGESRSGSRGDQKKESCPVGCVSEPEREGANTEGPCHAHHANSEVDQDSLRQQEDRDQVGRRAQKSTFCKCLYPTFLFTVDYHFSDISSPLKHEISFN